MGKSEILFSVILPVFHGGHFLDKALQTLSGMDYPGDAAEIIVAGSARDDESSQTAAAHAGRGPFPVRYAASSLPSRAGFLNAACATARGRYLAFADDDCFFPPDWLRRIEKAFAANAGAGAAGGADIFVDRGIPFLLALECALRSPLATGHLSGSEARGPVAYFPKLFNMAVPRRIAEDVAFKSKDGPLEVFDSRLDIHEDVELGLRIRASGRSLIFDPEIRVFHYRNATYREFLHTNLRLGRAARLLGVHRLPQTVLAAIIPAGLSIAAVSVTIAGLAWMFPAAAAVYAMPLVIEGIRAAAVKRSGSLLWRVPFVLASLHFSRGLGFWFARRDRRRVRRHCCRSGER